MCERADDKCYECNKPLVEFDYDEIKDFENKLVCDSCYDKPSNIVDFPWHFFSYERPICAK
ncbi:MAG: hypothetical protein KAJ07_00410 [Planctomycetes bacterium]|nr:hypothetical protein [Planctomycetota bacterium]